MRRLPPYVERHQYRAALWRHHCSNICGDLCSDTCIQSSCFAPCTALHVASLRPENDTPDFLQAATHAYIQLGRLTAPASQSSRINAPAAAGNACVAVVTYMEWLQKYTPVRRTHSEPHIAPPCKFVDYPEAQQQARCVASQAEHAVMVIS